MEEDERINNFISRIKDFNDKLEDIGEVEFSNDLVTITLNEILDECQIFTICLATREKDPTFDELVGIPMLENERRRNLKSQSFDLAFVRTFR